jgi:hypothetical protein
VPIQLYVGATGKVVPEWEKALVGGRAPKKRPLVGGRAFPTLYCFSDFLRTSLHEICTTEIGINCDVGEIYERCQHDV